MKLALILLVSAALLLWVSSNLDGMGRDSSVVAPVRPHQAHRVRSAQLLAQNLTNADAGAPPLFRAAAPPAELAGPQPGALFTLVGLAGDGAARVALLRDRADHQVFSARNGDSVRDWTLAEMNRSCVLLRKGRQRQNVCLS